MDGRFFENFRVHWAFTTDKMLLLSLVGSVVSLIERIVDKHTDMERELDDLVVRVDALERAHVTEPAA